MSEGLKNIGKLIMAIAIPLGFAVYFLDQMGVAMGAGTANDIITAILTTVKTNITLLGIVIVAIFIGGAYEYVKNFGGGK